MRTTTEKMTLRGLAALDYADRHGLSLSKFADPIEGERDDLTIEAALEIAGEDASLIHLDVDVTAEAMEAECLRCSRTGSRTMVIGATEYDSLRAVDACPRCGSHDARAL